MENWKKITLGVCAVVLILILITTALWIWWGLHGIELFTRRWIGNYGSISTAELGQTGDLFGGLNALFASFSAIFAALAFGGVVFAAYFQHHTLALAREQHVRQSFEPLFFQLLNLHREISNGALFSVPFNWIGRDINNADLGEIVDYLHDQIAKNISDIEQVKDKVVGESILIEPYEELYEINDDQLGTYFRSLYHIYKLVDQSDLSEDIRNEYANIARGLLGRKELFLLSVNCLSSYGAEFKPLVESYGLLKHARVTNRGEPNLQAFILDHFYKPTARMSANGRRAFLQAS